MKILVVEDDGAKLRNIVSALIEIDGVALEDISHVGDAVGAKRFLRESNVDLIVLDLHLPDRMDLPPQPSGGLDFVRSIASRPNFFVPPHVIAMSGNSDALALPDEDVGELWGIIRYSARTGSGANSSATACATRWLPLTLFWDSVGSSEIQRDEKPLISAAL